MAKRARRHHVRNILILVLLVLIGFGIFRYSRPLPAISSVSLLKPAAVGTASVGWPSTDEAAVGAMGYGVLAVSGEQTALPTASVAKLITALTVLKKYPLAAGTQGPTITFTQADVDLYNHYVAEDGSVVQVNVGDQLSEYQILQGMLLPSANNLADSLAVWAFGSLPAYTAAATEYIQSLGLSNTTIGSDASGFLPGTVSTAHDLVLLGETALSNPVLKDIVGQSSAILPTVGTIYNVNQFLNQDGIIGIKTGNTNQAGGVYVFAANYNVDPLHGIIIVGAVEGSTSLQSALNDGVALLNSAKQNFVPTTIVSAGQLVGRYSAPWLSKPVNATATKDVSALVWKGSIPAANLSLRAVTAPQASGTTVGSVTLGNPPIAAATNVILQQKLSSPPLWWRIIRHNLF